MVCVALPLLGLLAVLLVIGIMGAAAGSAASPDICVRCGYPVAGLTSGVCPECGVLLPQPGLHKPAWEWAPPIPARYASLVALMALCAVLCWWVANERGNLATRDVLEFEVAPSSGAWKAKFKSVGEQSPSSPMTVCTRRPSTLMTLTTSAGERVRLELIDVSRRGKYKEASGEEVTTVNSVGPEDIAALAASIRDPLARQSVVRSTASLLHCLELGPSGTLTVTGKGLTVLSEHVSASDHLTTRALVSAGVAVLALFGAGVYGIRRRPEQRLELWRSKPNRGVEPF